MELVLQIFLHIKHIFFRLQISFAIGIKKCACTRSNKSFARSKTALQFPYDTIITLRILHRNIILKYRNIPLIHPLYIGPPPNICPLNPYIRPPEYQ